LSAPPLISAFHEACKSAAPMTVRKTEMLMVILTGCVR
jgi:hypothetical protein